MALPPVFIFPRVRFASHMLRSAPAKVTRKYKLCNTDFMAAMFGPDSAIKHMSIWNTGLYQGYAIGNKGFAPSSCAFDVL